MSAHTYKSAERHIGNSSVNSIVQARLQVGAVNDPLEQQADKVADQVMRMPENELVQRKCSACEEEDRIQRKPLAAFIQKKGARGGLQASESVSNRINASRGKGSPLPSSTKSFMESRYGSNFSNVNIHTGKEAVQMSRELGAKAFTVGNDIYFNASQFSPSTGEGKHLLAHELTHTIQQSDTGKSIQMQRITRNPNIYETTHEGDRYRVRRVRIPRQQRSSRTHPPSVGFDADQDNVTLQISWCQGTRGQIQIGANLTGQALSLAQQIAGIITRGGTPDEVLEALRSTDVTPFVETVIARSGQWRIFLRGDITVGADGVTAGSGRVGIRRGPVDLEVAGTGDENGGNVSVQVRVTPGRRDETFDCPRQVTVRQTYVNRYICERFRPAHEETRTRTVERDDVQTRYVYFDYAEDVIDETRSQETLHSIENLLSNGYRVTNVEGFTSPEGTESPGRRFIGNIELGQRRANTALARLQAICLARSSSLINMRSCTDNALANVTPMGQSELYGHILDENSSPVELRGNNLEEHAVTQFREQGQESPHRSESFLQSLEGLSTAEQADRIYPLLRRAKITFVKSISEEIPFQEEIPAGYGEVACPEELLTEARINFNLQDAFRQ
ncbi:MAG: DUF4157 domain-containing protein [Saonia sp.]